MTQGIISGTKTWQGEWQCILSNSTTFQEKLMNCRLQYPKTSHWKFGAFTMTLLNNRFQKIYFNFLVVILKMEHEPFPTSAWWTGSISGSHQYSSSLRSHTRSICRLVQSSYFGWKNKFFPRLLCCSQLSNFEWLQPKCLETIVSKTDGLLLWGNHLLKFMRFHRHHKTYLQHNQSHIGLESQKGYDAIPKA